MDKVLKNWQIAPLVHAQSGAPLNVTTGVDNSLAGTNTIADYDRQIFYQSIHLRLKFRSVATIH